MRRAEFLSWVVWGTVALVGAGALLIVVWVFDQALEWDIFHGQVEQLLYGVLGSALALGACGAAIGFLLSFLEIAHGVGQLNQTLSRDSVGSLASTDAGSSARGLTGSSARRFFALAATVAAVVIGLLASLAWVNHQVQDHRGKVFERIAMEQLSLVEPRVRDALVAFGRPRPEAPPMRLVKTLRKLHRSAFCQGVTLLLLDPEDPTVLWRYQTTLHRDWQANRFESFLVARRSDHAVREALNNQVRSIESLNGGPGFVFYHVVRDNSGVPLVVVRVDGNGRESFRDYESYATASIIDS